MIYMHPERIPVRSNALGFLCPWFKEQGTAARPRLEMPEYIAAKGPDILDVLVSPGITAAGEFLGLGIYRDQRH
jgi:hypothetical protein